MSGYLSIGLDPVQREQSCSCMDGNFSSLVAVFYAYKFYAQGSVNPQDHQGVEVKGYMGGGGWPIIKFPPFHSWRRLYPDQKGRLGSK